MIHPVFYFQLHQPRRLRKYSVFDTDGRYFDDDANGQICRRIAEKCYRPGLTLLLELCSAGFACGLSISGSLLEQLDEYATDVVDLLHQLAATGSCEFLSETYHHSLAALYSPTEFEAQVKLHARALAAEVGASPRVLRNTELIYSNDVATMVAGLHDASGNSYIGMLTEHAPSVFGGRGPAGVYAPAGISQLKILTRHAELSDDVAFRFSAKGQRLAPAEYAQRIARAAKLAPVSGGLVPIFMDFETFGEHQWAQSGIFEFLRALPGALKESGAVCLTPSQALERPPIAVVDCPHPISWADEARDVSAWRGNAMQVHACESLYRLEQTVKATGDQKLLNDWRALTTSDHVYYMSTKGGNDGAVHASFRAFESPYESYVAFMNVLTDLSRRAGAAAH